MWREEDEVDSWIKLCLRRFRLDTRKNLFTEQAVKQWNRLLRAVAESPSLEIFKKCVDMAYGTT